ncbi:MAG: ATP-binding cassette domain-containing protein [Betaproteobacteria bacterium]
MALITLLDAQLAYGHVALLDHTDFALEERERVGLIGRNGTGKSSLLKILAGLEHADDGRLLVQQQLRIAYVPQEPLLSNDSTVFMAVSEGLAALQGWIADYLQAQDGTDLNALQSQIEAQDGWNWEQRVQETLQRLKLDGDVVIGTLSGGTLKRVALARALVARPDVLLLDEPTNHLDLDAITWLEDLLIEFKGSVVTITHDRAFLDRVATSIVELDRGLLRRYPGNFAQYVTQKQEQMAQEAVVQAKADRLLAQEEIWIRKGVEARRTRAVARIKRLQDLRAQHAARRNAMGRVNLDLSSGDRSGKIVAELENVSKSFDTGSGRHTVVHQFSATVLRGDKIGLIGPNGAGKSTLLKLVLGELPPDPSQPPGTVRQGTQLQVAYFDQMRDALDLNATLEDFISPGSEWVEVNGERKHVRSYLGDFLFSPARAQSPVRTLSGGERNRLLLARLFARPANVLVLDEPTNDLDIDTLELLEELLQSYDGTVLLVSHDRRFLDGVVTSVIVHEGTAERPGLWRQYEGGVSDWLIQSARARQIAAAPAVSKPSTSKAPPPPSGPAGTASPAAAPLTPKRKLSYREQQEFNALPGRIEALETEQKALDQTLGEGSIYVTDPERAAELSQRAGHIEEELLQALMRWEALGQ